MCAVFLADHGYHGRGDGGGHDLSPLIDDLIVLGVMSLSPFSSDDGYHHSRPEMLVMSFIPVEMTFDVSSFRPCLSSSGCVCLSVSGHWPPVCSVDGLALTFQVYRDVLQLVGNMAQWLAWAACSNRSALLALCLQVSVPIRCLR